MLALPKYVEVILAPGIDIDTVIVDSFDLIRIKRDALGRVRRA